MSGANLRPPNLDKAWVRDELKLKASTDWVKSELNALRSLIQEQSRRADEMGKTLSIAEQNSRNHTCEKEAEILELKKWKNHASSAKIGAVLAFIALLAGGMAQYFSLTNSVTNTQVDVKEIKIDVQELAKSQRNLERTVSQQMKNDNEQSKNQLTEIKDLLEDVVKTKKNKK